ncbi:MAG: hypothetical protein FVQ80_05030 [Planctomycetes bacterium]|nr:hypothetical protein [Planctomycetota bacterium]
MKNTITNPLYVLINQKTERLSAVFNCCLQRLMPILLIGVLLVSVSFGQSETNNSHEHSHELQLFKLVKPMGITTLSLLFLTVTAGLLRHKNPKLIFKWHKRLGITTLVSAIIHALLVLILY